MVEYKYDAWGNHEATVADETHVTLAEINPFRYRSYYYDSETGLYFLQTRYYDPEVGRFISRDSIEYADPEIICGLNLYAYCGNNPVINVDPMGNAWWDWLLGGLTLLAGVALCFVPGGQVFGVGLIVGGTSSLLSSTLNAVGVDGKISSIITSGLSIVAGIALCFTPFAGIGAGLIGQGAGSLVGGYISESLGGSFTTGAAIGGFIGSIVGGVTYRGVTNFRLSRMTPYQKGLMGEKYVQAVTRIKAHTISSGKLRPDFVNNAKSILIDSKNVATQGFTNQLRAYLNLGYQKNIIYVRLGTKISSALKRCIMN